MTEVRCRLAIDATRPPDSGIGRYSWGLVAAAARLAPRVRVLAVTTDDLRRRADVLGVETLLVGEPPRSIGDLRAREALLDRHADVYVATHFSQPAIPRIPVIQVVHDLLFPQHPQWQPTMNDLEQRHQPSYLRALVEEFLPMAREIMADVPGAWRALPPNPRDPVVGELYRFLFSAAIVRAKATFAVSRDVAREVCKYYPTRRPVAVVPPVVRRLPAPSADTRGADVKRVLYVANFEPRKNHALLFQAMAAAPLMRRDDVMLQLVGHALFPSHGRALQAALDASGVRHRVRIGAELEDEELGRVYGAADVFAYPSVAEGFGIPLAEALHEGVPVVAMDTTFARDICGGVPSFTTSDPSEFAATIDAVLGPVGAAPAPRAPHSSLLRRFTVESVAAVLWEGLVAAGLVA